jgi:hypothetical protein
MARETQPPSDTSVDLPEPEAEQTGDHDIVADNVRALQPAYFSVMFDVSSSRQTRRVVPKR